MKSFLSILTAALLASGMAMAQGQTQAQTQSGALPTEPTAGQASGQGGGASGGKSGASAPAMPAPSTRQFVQKASRDGMLEVRAGSLAARQGQSQAVKNFGKRMMQDHAKLNRQLKHAVDHDKKNPGLKPATHLSLKQQHEMALLKAAEGKDFDKRYARLMTRDHTRAVALFKAYSKSGNDPKIKGVAKKALPVLKEHLYLIHGVDRKLGIPTKG